MASKGALNKSCGHIQLASPGKAVDLLVIAGEHSGDQHAAAVVAELRQLRPGWHIAAIGGPALRQQSDSFLYDLAALSVVGLVEVLRHYHLFRQLFQATLDWIAAYRPRGVVLVDYPGFNLRLADALRRRGLSRKGGGDVAVYQYVSPQIWAWKARRRFRMAEVLDELGVIFPFEIDCYRDTHLPVHFVGHPFVAAGHDSPLSHTKDGPVLLLPGSRAQAVRRIFPVLLASAALIHASDPATRFVCLYPDEHIRAVLVDLLNQQAQAAEWLQLQPAGSACAASAVLTSSGTMSLHCALAGIPGAIVYRAHPLTAAIARRLLRVPYLGIANIILGQAAYPEFLQQQARPAALASFLHNLRADTTAPARYATYSRQLHHALRAEEQTSAARRIARLLGAP